MHKFTRRAEARLRPRAFFIALIFSPALLGVGLDASSAQSLPATQSTMPAQAPTVKTARTPTQTVKDFYQALREKRFRDAFAISIYRPAIEGLSPDEFEDLRPEFEKLAAAVPEKIEISGEQISGDTATVFAKVGDDAGAQTESIPLILVDGQWIFGDRENQEIVRRDGKEFFPKARIETHHAEVGNMLLKLAAEEALYASQHGGVYADLPTLLQSGKPSLREDVEAAQSLGYQFQITPGKDGKSYHANAEPVRYGHTGRLSFYMDAGGIQKKDTGGKPYNPPAKR